MTLMFLTICEKTKIIMLLTRNSQKCRFLGGITSNSLIHTVG